MKDPTTELVDVTAVADFESFYRSHHQPILHTALALTRDRRAAEDLTQDAFVAARHNWARISAYDWPEFWVRRVVINLSASRLRRATAISRRAMAAASSGSPPSSALVPTCRAEGTKLLRASSRAPAVQSSRNLKGSQLGFSRQEMRENSHQVRVLANAHQELLDSSNSLAKTALN